MKIVICDDNMQFCFALEKMILSYAAEQNYKLQTEVLNSGEQLKAYLDAGQQADAIYLDIEMPGLNGVELGRYIRENLGDLLMQIVYISSHKKYAMELFSASPLHFLVKPLNADEVFGTLDRIFRLLGRSRQTFSYQIGHDTGRVPISDIFYFKSLGREVEMHSEQGLERFYAPLSAIYRQLEAHRFFYCHQSYLVNYNQIKQISAKEIKMKNGRCIPVSQGKWPLVKSLQMRFAKEDL